MGVPLATYRIQLGPDFGFDAAAGLAAYLADLGVSHLYTAPILQAAPGSTHGYDVADPTRISEALGGAEAHARLAEALASRGLGLVLDIVPNHMWVGGPENRWWWDVLMRGPESRFARFFDISWEPAEVLSPPRVLLPVLGEEPREALEAGDLHLGVREGEIVFRYYDKVFPLAPGSLYAAGLEGVADETPEDRAARIGSDVQAVEALLARQHYRLAHWRVASQEVNYRRFFHITQLAGVRVEAAKVFKETHALVLDLVERGVVQGLRVDHVDGLRDPTGYLRRLRRAAPSAWIVVEKILETGEALSRRWPVAGTTGYDFARVAGGVFVDPAGEAPLVRLYAEETGNAVDWEGLVLDSKLFVLEGLLAAEVEHLVELLDEVCARRERPTARVRLRDGLRAFVACFPVYRTYLRPREVPSGDDAEVIRQAIACSKEHRRHLAEVVDLLAEVLFDAERDEVADELAMRLQQLTGPAMAKGVEDTAFYRDFRFVALNEVGGDPGRFGSTVEALHAHNARTLARWPEAMLCTSTHDTKRSEDVRARLYLLSEIPERWAAAVRRFGELAEPYRRGEAPTRADLYLLWQTLVGAWPISEDRLAAFMEKAVREEKRSTSWIDPAPAYEEALRGFIAGVMRDEALLSGIEAFVAPLVEPGRITSLALRLLELTSPGVPDVYQGCELWDLSLVDPDNRRPVDFELRRRLLAELGEHPAPEAVLARMDEGLPKLWLTREALRLRRRRQAAFGPKGAYAPLEASGSRSGHVVAYARGREVAVVVPRLVMGLGGARADWRLGATAVDLPEGSWRDVFSGTVHPGGRVPLEALLAAFPVALLERTEEARP